MTSELLKNLRKNNIRIISRLISQIENGNHVTGGILNSLFPFAQDAIRIGVTGPPGVGKSTLIDRIIQYFRNEKKSVGVISVDPTSPFSGGALLGDRVRMFQHTLDKQVYIRSMGTRGQTGGLARMSHQVADILACSGKDYILFETVGIGQVEMEIRQYVDLTIVLFVPESGDEIQFLKAGPIEFGDIFVINKADREGAEQIFSILQSYIKDSFSNKNIVPKIIQTIATEDKGIESLYRECIDLVEKFKESGTFVSKRANQYLAQVQTAVRQELVNQFWNRNREEDLKKRIEELRTNNISPYEAADRLISHLL